jgi:hypothetical protein
MAALDYDTNSTDSSVQNKIACALSKLNKQRIYQSNIAAEGQDNHALSASRKIHNAQQAQEAVDALRKVVLV